jgi:phosphatidylserine/phosphatidylglycerophosphate/cardiolipin synthase-like enzyme
MPKLYSGLFSVALLAALSGCTASTLGEDEHAIGAATIASGSAEEAAVLALVNDPQVDFALLDDDVALDKRAATNIIAYRDGADALPETADDDLFDSVGELDAIPYVGSSALDKLLAYAVAHGYMPGTEAPTEEELVFATLALANDPNVDVVELDDAVSLDKRAAANIIEWRAGVDGIDGTPDDRTFMNIDQLDAIGYVGANALGRMRDYAVSNGYLDLVPDGVAEVIFSPQSYFDSHNAHVIQLIDAAQDTIDIAMYSLSDNSVYNAIEAAVNRGVSIRFLFDTASDDRKKTGPALDSSRSARLEKMGINVRWVNKIMHHKFAIVDGPRNDLANVATATLVTGSGNWSHGAATRYDENTLFLQGQDELTLSMQQEFNHMWDHSRDFIYDATLPLLGSVAIADGDIEDVPSLEAHFTSDNFYVNGADTFTIITGNNTVSDAMVAAIDSATDSIWVASGHLRSRTVAEALIAKAQANPQLDVRVYLDGQEYISSWYQNVQLQNLADCIAVAGTSVSKLRKCYDKGFLFGYQVGDAGIPVRYKYYAYRWHYSYADQMHNKLMIIDGDELWTGSYNLSDNAEHNTFENMLVFRGLPYAALIEQYEDNFLAIWDTSRNDGTYDNLVQTVNTANAIPLVFEPMALDHAQIVSLKAVIKSNCPAVNSDPYRDDPAAHQVCPR